MIEKNGMRMVLAALAVGLTLVGCDADGGDVGELRQIEQQVEDLADAEAEISELLDGCEADYAGCLQETLGDLDACAPAFDACFGDLPGVEDEPEIPEIPDIPDDFSDVCVSDLWACIDGGGDPITCSTDAEACVTDAVSGLCEAAYDSCIDAGADAATCDLITAACVLP